MACMGATNLAWLMLFLAQATLVARGRVATHRRLGWAGPAIVVAPEGAATSSRATTNVAPEAGGAVSDSQVMRRYFAPRAPGQMSRHTEAIRRIIGQRKRRYWWGLIGLAAIGAGASWYAVLQRRAVHEQRHVPARRAALVQHVTTQARMHREQRFQHRAHARARHLQRHLAIARRRRRI